MKIWKRLTDRYNRVTTVEVNALHAGDTVLIKFGSKQFLQIEMLEADRPTLTVRSRTGLQLYDRYGDDIGILTSDGIEH